MSELRAGVQNLGSMVSGLGFWMFGVWEFVVLLWVFRFRVVTKINSKSSRNPPKALLKPGEQFLAEALEEAAPGLGAAASWLSESFSGLLGGGLSD